MIEFRPKRQACWALFKFQVMTFSDSFSDGSGNSGSGTPRRLSGSLGRDTPENAACLLVCGSLHPRGPARPAWRGSLSRLERQPPPLPSLPRAAAEGGEAATSAPDARVPQAAPRSSAADGAKKLWLSAPASAAPAGSPGFRAPAEAGATGSPRPAHQPPAAGNFQADPGRAAAPPSSCPAARRPGPDALPPVTSGFPGARLQDRPGSAPAGPEQNLPLPAPSTPVTSDLPRRARGKCDPASGADLALGLEPGGSDPGQGAEGSSPAATVPGRADRRGRFKAHPASRQMFILKTSDAHLLGDPQGLSAEYVPGPGQWSLKAKT